MRVFLEKAASEYGVELSEKQLQQFQLLAVQSGKILICQFHRASSKFFRIKTLYSKKF